MTWNDVARENYKTLKNIDPSNATMQQYLLYGATMALGGDKYICDEVISETEEKQVERKIEGLERVLIISLGEELEDADKYINLWHKTGDKEFKKIASEELSHAGVVAKYIRESGYSIDMNPYMVHFNAIQAKLA